MPAGRIGDQLAPMSDIEPIRRGEQQCVTASQLVRHFGLWQERAAREPVYVLHRGRPRFVLTSIDVIEALCAPLAATTSDDNTALAALLDGDEAINIIFDRNGRVSIASRAARARFGEATRPGTRATGLAVAAGQMIEDAILRVAHGGIAETIEIIPDAFRTRRFRCELSPFPNGCLLRAIDQTTEQELLVARAMLLASTLSNAAAGAVCVRLSPRGYIVAPTPALSQLTGISPEALANARFVSLLTVASRVEAGEAIEAVASGEGPRRVDAELLVHGASPLPVTIGLAGTAISARIEELAVTIVRTCA